MAYDTSLFFQTNPDAKAMWSEIQQAMGQFGNAPSYWDVFPETRLSLGDYTQEEMNQVVTDASSRFPTLRSTPFQQWNQFRGRRIDESEFVNTMMAMQPAASASYWDAWQSREDERLAQEQREFDARMARLYPQQAAAPAPAPAPAPTTAPPQPMREAPSQAAQAQTQQAVATQPAVAPAKTAGTMGRGQPTGGEAGPASGPGMGTLLTGVGGISPEQLMLGRRTLLGA